MAHKKFAVAVPALIYFVLVLQNFPASSGQESGCITLPTLDCKGKLVPFGFGLQSQLLDPSFWPWHASIYWTNEAGTRYICGGVLIGPLSVLTAAHCLEKSRTFDPEFIVVIGAASSKYDTVSVSPGTKTYRVVKRDVHPEYRGSQAAFRADIAVLTLDKVVESSSTISPACLPPVSQPTGIIEGSSGDVVGFGADGKATPGKIEPSAHLKHVKLPIINSIQCSSKQGFDNKTMFCAGYSEDSGVDSDACLGPGDAGDGFIMTDDSFTPSNYVHGILSRGDLRCPSPVYFIAVAPYTPWINRVMEFRLLEYFANLKICIAGRLNWESRFRNPNKASSKNWKKFNKATPPPPQILSDF